MKDFVRKYSFNKHSQNGEDGIIAEVLKRLKILKGTAVEFGGADGYYCSNTANLKGWKRHLYDLTANGDVQAKAITPENVNELPACDLLSIDIDGNDYAVWKAYTGKPAVVIIEINSGFPPDVKHFSTDKGASYLTMTELGISKGYFLLCHTGNLVFVEEKYRSLFPEIKGNPITHSANYFNTAWLH